MNEQIDWLVVNDRIYVDFDSLLAVMYTSVVEGNVMATKMADPAMGVMVQGMASLCKAMEGTLAELRARAGLTAPEQSDKP
jgi:hypothetical protein